MTAAFVLGINMSVAGIFAVAFAVVAVTNRMARGAWWLALGCGMGIVNVGLEFLLRQQTDPVPVSVGIFLVFLSALSFALIGVARHYRVEPPWTAMTVIWIATNILSPHRCAEVRRTPISGFRETTKPSQSRSECVRSAP